MNTCRTCKHWKCHPSFRSDTKSSEECRPIRGSLNIVLDQNRGYNCGGATVDHITTSPDFGCVLWEPIADEPAKETT